MRSLAVSALAVFSLALLTFVPINAIAQQSQDAPVQPLPAAAAGKEQPVPDSSPDHRLSQALTLGIGDLVEVRFFGVPDLTQETRIGSAGDLPMVLVGPVHIAGLTPEQAAAVIADKYQGGGFLHAPQVTVFVKDYASQGVSVMGEVARPGIYPVLGPRRLFDVIAAAGGLTSRAGKLVTITRRDRPQDPIRISFSEDMAKSQENNVDVMPGDTVVVSRAGLVYVVGDVGRPGGFVMDNNERITVLQALALAGGVNRTAALNSAKLIRRSSEGPKEISLPLKQILAAKAADSPLQADDILFVPGSAAKSAAKRSVDAIIQVATGVAIYGTVR